MKSHHFDKSLQREKLASIHADAFYMRAPFSALNVERFNRNTETDLVFQHQDIDLCIYFKDGRKIDVSEKFRAYDYNDLLIELYSKYPHTKGWMHDSKAVRMAYFFPTRMFWINNIALRSLCLQQLFPLVSSKHIDELLAQDVSQLILQLPINGKTYHCTLMQAHNNINGDNWDTISISVPFELLKDCGVRFQQFVL